MNINISGDTSDHSGMRIQEKEKKGRRSRGEYADRGEKPGNIKERKIMIKTKKKN